MADSYWRYNEARPPPPASAIPPPVAGKRPRADYDPTGSHDLPGYFPRDNERGAIRGPGVGPGVGVGVGVRDTDSINESYDRYLRSTQVPPFGGAQPPRPMGQGMPPPNRPVEDPRLIGIDHGAHMKERPLGFGGGRPEVPLPPDASSTLFVEGLPPNCTRREVAHIFRPFVGYKEVRLVSKESRHPGGDPLVLCFVDFLSPAHAATAMDALQGYGPHYDIDLPFCQPRFRTLLDVIPRKLVKLDFAGYKFDEHERDSVHLRLQFARYPGARSGGAVRGKR